MEWEDVGHHHQAHVCVCSDFLFLLLKKQQHLCGHCDRGIEVTSTEAICIQLSVGGVQCLAFAV